VGRLGEGVQSLQKLSPRLKQPCAVLDQLRVPFGQALQRRRALQVGAQQVVALLQRALVVRKRVEVALAQQADFGIKEASAVGRLAAHDCQVACGEAHDAQPPDERARSRDGLLVEADAALALHLQAHLQVVGQPVRFVLGSEAHLLRAPLDEVYLAHGAQRAERAEVIDRLQQVRLALRVRAQQDVHARRGGDLRVRVVPKAA
jgi:hypothetical protein